ncbi:TonB-dependent receptor [Pseudoteredinibacter isoporae]|uniref:TonB-dependent receptor n=1 Tax=Pseudoteredinibacter isoporae TaxID=570281 RepID=UPI003104EA04
MVGINQKKSLLAAAVGLAVGLSAGVQAQETTSAIRGQVFGPQGNPATSASVTIVNLKTNRTNTMQTNDSGRFVAKGLAVGGPYKVTISKNGNTSVVDNVFLQLGGSYPITTQLNPSSDIEEVTVTATQLANTALGVSRSFDVVDLENAPTFNADIKDLIKQDPRVYIDESFSDAIQCAGANPRFNSLTVDGVRLNDNFGLNSNGYPTERMPFPFRAINQTSVELAPFDVQYGQFSACNINAVTKSGDNEFTGSVFYEFNDDSLSGDSLEGDSIDRGTFEKKRYGFTVGGPLIEDKLFFHASYYKQESANLFNRGPVGSGAAVEVQGLSQADFDRILQISRDVYGYDPGLPVSSLPNEDEKFLVKVDWNINDDHRAAFTYNYNDGFNISEADGDSNEFEFTNHYYERGAELNSYVAQFFSDWSDNFSTEVKVGYVDLDNRQISLDTAGFGEVRISTNNDGARANVFLGGDDSRQSNKLSYETMSYKFSGTYTYNDHNFTFGYEREEFDVFNLFIQHSQGEFRFNSIDDFEAGTPSRIYYGNAGGTNNPSDGAAEFGYDVNTVYFQDEYSFSSADVTLVVGARYDWYESDDLPTVNPAVEENYGFSNAQNMDGKDLFQPRVGFEWNVNDSLEIHGGVGVYSGGNPNVWISNNYSNDGVRVLQIQDRSGDSLFGYEYANGGSPIRDVPQHLIDAVGRGEGFNGGLNFMDPNFELPHSIKYALGGSYEFDDGHLFQADFLYSENKDSAIIIDATRETVGTAPDGRPIYGSINGRSQDFLLTNVQGDSGESTVVSFALSKEFDNGFDYSLSYAYTDATEISPMTSSVAFSNYVNAASSNPNAPDEATSNYVIPHRFTLTLGYEMELFDGLKTRFNLFGTANEGRPYSYTFDEGFIFGDSTGFISRHLVYVPTGADDPNVVFGDNFDTDAFFALVDSEGLARGQIMERNSLNGRWWNKFDLKVTQEIPGFAEDHKGKIHMTIKNVGNMLNDDWGVLYEPSFPRSQPIVAASINDNGQYVYEEFIKPAGETRVARPSFWELWIGVEYKF